MSLYLRPTLRPTSLRLHNTPNSVSGRVALWVMNTAGFYKEEECEEY